MEMDVHGEDSDVASIENDDANGDAMILDFCYHHQ